MKTIKEMLIENTGTKKQVYLWLGDEIISYHENCDACYKSISFKLLSCKCKEIKLADDDLNIDISIKDFKNNFKI